MHLDRPRFDADLRAAAVRAGVVLISGLARGIQREDEADTYRFSASEPVDMRARFVVDATGRAAAVAYH